MSFAQTFERITAGDEELEKAIEDAHLPTLLVALAHVTGTDSLLRADLTPDMAFLAGPQGGYDDDQIARGRSLCLEALKTLRDAEDTRPADPDPELLRSRLAFLIGDERLDAGLPLAIDELALDGEDVRAPSWSKSEIAPDRAFRVVVIGAGMSGLAASFRLGQAGIDHVVYEKNTDVGGTWLENVYPGCRVDVPNHFYSYSFAQKQDWPQIYSKQEVLLDYFRDCADRFDLRSSIQFETEVVEASWDDERALWSLSVRGSDGKTRVEEAHAIVSAVGQLNRPKMPEIDGLEGFEGPTFHSAEWDSNVRIEGKRVAIIGTGASAAQFIPPVSDIASRLFVFQRTAPWLLPTPDYHDEVPAGLQWLFRHVPFYAQWYRFWLFWQSSDGLLESVRVEDDWPHPERSVGAANDMIREILTAYLRECCDGDDELYAKMLPDYPPCSKRFVRDNGLWPATFKKENVSLETTGIERITPTGIEMKDGRHIEVDVIIYGTGFTASDFLMPMKMTGRGGRDLHETWAGDARAYLGITIPHFPNLFLMYGPNTNIVVNGSIIFFSECEVDYILECVRLLLEQGSRALDCRPGAHDAYNRRIDAANAQMAWGAATVNTWYRNAKGRISQNWPGNLLEYWQQTRAPKIDDYEIL